MWRDGAVISRRACFLGWLSALATCSSIARASSQRFTVGVLFGGEPTGSSLSEWLEFVAELRRLGYLEGTNITFIKRVGDIYRPDLLQRLAGELVAARVDLIYTAGGTPAAAAAKRATHTIPIVFNSSGDPVGLKLVNSLDRPGGNMTGSAIQNDAVFVKGLEFFAHTVPELVRIVCIQPAGIRNLSWFHSEQAAAEAGARKLRIDFSYADVRSVAEVEPLLASYTKQRVGVVVEDHPEFSDRLENIAATCLGFNVPAMGDARRGFLLHYRMDQRQLGRKAANYVDKILRGTKPSALPVEQVSSFELVVNQKVAAKLGIRIPPSILARTDELLQ